MKDIWDLEGLEILRLNGDGWFSHQTLQSSFSALVICGESFIEIERAAMLQVATKCADQMSGVGYRQAVNPKPAQDHPRKYTLPRAFITS